MVQYAVKKINLEKVKDINDYWCEVKRAEIKYCNGIEELRQYCGGKLYKQRCGYSGINGNIEYIAERV